MAYDKNFPVEIDLGQKPMEAGPQNATPNKSKKYYPTLYINNVDGLKDMPSSGYALIKYKRKGATIGEDDKLKSADLEVQEICLPKGSGASGEDETLEDAMKNMMEDKKSSYDESDETDDEESAEGMTDDEG